MRVRLLTCVSVLALGAGALGVLGAGGAQAQEASAETKTDKTVDELVVTGEKFGRTLKDTATSVGVLTEKQIEAATLIDAQDAYDELVNVNMAGANNRFVIRGIPFDNVNGAGFGQLGVVYVDGVRMGDKSTAFGPDLLWDIRSIEVLRGAQSTLQGRNALAGAIYLNTNDPTWAWDARARVIGAEQSWSASVAFGGPIVADKLAFRVAVDRRRSDGFIHDPIRDEDADVADDWQYRAKLLFEPTDKLTVRAVVNYADIDRSEAAADRRVLGADGFLPRNPSGVPGFENGAVATGAPARRQTYVDIDDYERNKTLAAALTADYAITDALTLTSETTYEDTDDFEQDDSDGGIFNYTGVPGPTIRLVNPFGIGDFELTRGGVVPTNPIAVQHEDFTIFSQELRLKYDADGRVRGLLGAYYTDEREREDNFTLLVFRNVRPLVAQTARGLGVSAAQANQFAALYSDDAPLYTFNSQPVDVTNYAFYGEGEFDVTPQLTLNAGLRYDHEKNTSGVINSGEVLGLANPAQIPNATLAALARGVNAALDPFVEAEGRSKLKFEAWLPKAGIRYRLNDDVTAGVVVQRAYRAGGVSVNVVRQLVTELKPEYTWNYEAYLRADLGDRGRVSANVFYVDWKDQQVTVDLSDRESDQVGANAGSSELYGFEVEFTARLNEAFSVNGGLGYSHTEFKEFDITLPPSTAALGVSVDPNALDGLEGNRFAYAPRWSAVLAVAWEQGNAFANVSANYESESFADIANTRKNDARTLVNARVGYDFGRLRASVFGRNLFDVDYVRTADARRPLLGDPRVVGVVLEARY